MVVTYTHKTPRDDCPIRKVMFSTTGTQPCTKPQDTTTIESSDCIDFLYERGELAMFVECPCHDAMAGVTQGKANLRSFRPSPRCWSLVQSWVEQKRKGVDDGRGGLMSEKDPTRHQNSECSKNLGTDSKISTPISCNTETIFRSCKTFMLTALTVRLLHFP